LAVERQVVIELGDDDVGKKRRASPTTGDRMVRRWRLHHGLAKPAGEGLTHVTDNLEAAWHVVESLGHVGADPAQCAATVRTAAGAGMDDLLPRQMFGQRSSRRLGGWFACCLDQLGQGRVGRDSLRMVLIKRLNRQFELLGVTLPVFSELHAKVTLRDTRQTIRRDAPFLIWIDETQIDWTAAERRQLESSPETRRFAGMLPGGVHVRPVDLTHGDELYLIWTFETAPRPFVWPPEFDSQYAEVVLRGCARMIPGMASYVPSSDRGIIDGGYYCKTPENRPLIGPLPVEGAYVLGALSGMGVMSSHAGAELLAAHVAEQPLPDYAPWFLPSRYDDPAYRALVEQWGPLVGQL
jgi:hypothetical protein